jgi:hypothetical protein
METNSINDENSKVSLYLKEILEMMQISLMEPFVEVDFKLSIAKIGNLINYNFLISTKFTNIRK